MNNFTDFDLLDKRWWTDVVLDSVTKLDSGQCNHVRTEGDGTDGHNLVIKSTRITDKVEKMKNKIQKADRFADITFDMSEFYFDQQQVTNISDMTARQEANVITPTWINFSAKLELERMIMTPEQEKR